MVLFLPGVEDDVLPGLIVERHNDIHIAIFLECDSRLVSQVTSIDSFSSSVFITVLLPQIKNLRP